MQEYWTESFLEAHVTSALVQGMQLARNLWEAVLFAPGTVGLFPRKTMIVILAISAVGAIALGRRSIAMAVMLLAPAALTALAAIARYWPLTPRLMLFVAPAVVITLAAGDNRCPRRPAKARMPAQTLLSAVLIAASILGIRTAMRSDSRFVAVPDALRQVVPRVDSTATVYLSADIVPACRYYLRWHPAA